MSSFSFIEKIMHDLFCLSNLFFCFFFLNFDYILVCHINLWLLILKRLGLRHEANLLNILAGPKSLIVIWGRGIQIYLRSFLMFLYPNINFKMFLPDLLIVFLITWCMGIYILKHQSVCVYLLQCYQNFSR